MFKPGISGNPTGRKKGQHSPENKVFRAEDTALRTIARAAEKGDVGASIAVLKYCSQYKQRY